MLTSPQAHLVLRGDGAKEKDVVEHLVVKGEVIARDMGNSGLFLDVPMLSTEILVISMSLLISEISRFHDLD